MNMSNRRSRRGIYVLETEDDNDDNKTQCSDPSSECQTSSLPDAQDFNTYFEEDNEEIENADARSTSHSPDLFDRNSDLGKTKRSPLKELSDIPNKRKAEIIGDQNESQLLVASKIRRGEGERFENFGGGTKNNTEDEKHEDKRNSADRVPDSQSESEDKDPKPKCAKCLFEKELDKINYYFGNLLTGELQFVPPCMRSVAYIEILKYIDSLKQRHRNE